MLCSADKSRPEQKASPAPRSTITRALAGRGLLHCSNQLQLHFRRHRVAPLGTIERDRPDTFVLRNQNRLNNSIDASDYLLTTLRSRAKLSRNFRAYLNQTIQRLQLRQSRPSSFNSAMSISVGIFPTSASCAKGQPPSPPIAASNRLHPAL